MRYKKETPFDRLKPEELDVLYSALNHHVLKVENEYYETTVNLLKMVEDSIKFKEFAQHGG